MPKENRRSSSSSSSSSSKGNNRRRSCEDSDDGKKSSLRDTPKITGSSVNRFSPFQRDVSRRESRSGEEETFTTLVRSNTKSGGIIENGMKYIMFPLHLLRFCIFGTTTLSIDDGKSKDRKGSEATKEKNEEKGEKEIRGKDETAGSREKGEEGKVEKRSSDVSKKLLKDKKSCDAKNHRETSRDRRDSSVCDDRSNERGDRKERSRSSESRKSFGYRRTDDDSDSSSSDKWSTAESSMDVSIEYESTYESMSYRLEEPMDISIEESIEENSPRSSRIVSHRTARVGPPSSSSSSSEIEESSSSSSIDEEISRVFQRKCTSSSDDDDDTSPSTSYRDKRRDESDRRDRKNRENVASRESIPESKLKSERKGIESNIRKKEENFRDKTVERATSAMTSCGHSSSPRRVSRTPVKSKDTRKRYKEKGVQTDSAFSDDDVEMIPLDTRSNEKRVSNRTSRRKPPSVSYQMEGMDQDILYIADNEDSNDGCGRNSRNRISPISESSSSTDLGFEDQRCFTRSCRARVTDKGRAKSPLRDDTTATITDLSKKVPVTRAPPGFPQVPQNPPISLKSWSDQGSLNFPFLTETNLHVPQYGQSYPPAPTPMRHLYHEYPEFMPFPEEIGTLQIFKTISTNGYLR